MRKIGAPYHEELAIGAVVDGPHPDIILNQSIIDGLGVPSDYVQRVTDQELAEIARRKALYFRGRSRVDAKGKTAIVVDDGIATGATMRAALSSIRHQSPARLVLAVPVATLDTIAELRPEIDEIVCLYQPEWLGAISVFYEDFRQVSDEEVVDLLDRATGLKSAKAPAPAGATSKSA